MKPLAGRYSKQRSGPQRASYGVSVRWELRDLEKARPGETLERVR